MLQLALVCCGLLSYAAVALASSAESTSPAKAFRGIYRPLSAQRTTGAIDDLSGLIAEVNGSDVQRTLRRRIVHELQEAKAALRKPTSDVDQSCNTLREAIKVITANAGHEGLSNGRADEWVSDIQQIQAEIPCGGSSEEGPPVELPAPGPGNEELFELHVTGAATAGGTVPEFPSYSVSLVGPHCSSLGLLTRVHLIEGGVHVDGSLEGIVLQPLDQKKPVKFFKCQLELGLPYLVPPVDVPPGDPVVWTETGSHAEGEQLGREIAAVDPDWRSGAHVKSTGPVIGPAGPAPKLQPPPGVAKADIWKTAWGLPGVKGVKVTREQTISYIESLTGHRFLGGYPKPTVSGSYFLYRDTAQGNEQVEIEVKPDEPVMAVEVASAFRYNLFTVKEPGWRCEQEDSKKQFETYCEGGYTDQPITGDLTFAGTLPSDATISATVTSDGFVDSSPPTELREICPSGSGQLKGSKTCLSTYSFTGLQDTVTTPTQPDNGRPITDTFSGTACGTSPLTKWTIHEDSESSFQTGPGVGPKAVTEDFSTPNKAVAEYTYWDNGGPNGPNTAADTLTLNTSGPSGPQMVLGLTLTGTFTGTVTGSPAKITVTPLPAGQACSTGS